MEEQMVVPPSRSGIQYGSYLLRLRWFEQNGQRQCQYMLHDPRSGEQHHFRDLESLAGFLRQVVGLEPKAADCGGVPPR